MSVINWAYRVSLDRSATNEYCCFYRFTGCCWISTLVVGRDGSWNVKVKVDLTVRPDGKINSSPVTATRPIYRLQHGCRHVISIPGKVTSSYNVV